jgi:hypothetical protein
MGPNEQHFSRIYCSCPRRGVITTFQRLEIAVAAGSYRRGRPRKDMADEVLIEHDRMHLAPELSITHILEPSAPTSVPAVNLARITLKLMGAKPDSWLSNAYIQRYHYLGHQLLPGAQLRYFVRAAGEVIALLGFGASAWKTKPRDQFIGWTSE